MRDVISVFHLSSLCSKYFSLYPTDVYEETEYSLLTNLVNWEKRLVHLQSWDIFSHVSLLVTKPSAVLRHRTACGPLEDWRIERISRVKKSEPLDHSSIWGEKKESLEKWKLHL
jgi:hypothetical protein